MHRPKLGEGLRGAKHPKLSCSPPKT